MVLVSSKRWWVSIPFVVAVGVLILLIWTGYGASNYPNDGIRSIHQPTGRVDEIYPNGPSSNLLEDGDIIQSVDGVPWEVAQLTYTGRRAGDEVHFIVDRKGATIHVTIELADPPLSNVLLRLEPLFVALIFWLIGVGVQAFRISSSDADVFFAWCQACTLFLIAGTASYLGPSWSFSVFNALFWLIGPVSVHLHMRFPQPLLVRWQRLVLGVLYTAGFAGGLPFLIWGSDEIRAFPWYSQLVSASRFFLAINLLTVVGLLFYSYWHTTYAGVRSKIRIVFLGAVLSVLPVVTLSILPEALIQQAIVSVGSIFLVLGILPFTYGYAIFRLHIVEIEKHVNRGATYLLVYSIIGAIYLILYALIGRWLPAGIASHPLTTTVLILVLASAVAPIYRQVQKFVDTVFYGGWYDYRSAVKQITQGIEQITDLRTLANVVSERLVNTLQLQDTCVFLRDLGGEFSVIEVSHREISLNTPEVTFSTLPRSSLSYLMNMGAVEKSYLRNAISELTLTPEELQLLESEQANLWVPIIGHGEVLGLLALGQRFGGDIFSGEDMDILRLVVRQIGPVIENIHLLTRLRQHAAELEERVAERTAELHNAKERVEAVLASVGDGVVVTDLTGTIQTVNAAFESMAGFRSDELIGRNLFQMLNLYNTAWMLEEMRTALDRDNVWSGELISQRKSGQLYDIQLTIAPVHDQNGNKISYVGSQRDITRQKELDRLKDNFVSDVSHELRTPTANISLYLELLEHAPKEKTPKYLKVIKEQSQLLSKLVEDILDLSRLKMGKAKKIEFAPVDFNTLTEQVIVAHLPLADASGLNLQFTPCADLPPVRGEKNQLARVVTNLVSNAIRYTFDGSVLVSTCRENGGVCLNVSDTGIGIDPEDLGHIFERFYRGSQVRQSEIHGTGLGLAIVKEIVDLHDGVIELSSQVGKGTTFRIYLPIYSA